MSGTVTEQPSGGDQVKLYKYEEISKHNGKKGNRCWMVYKDIVYDFTDYMEEHPGGADLITEYGGKDGTVAYDDAGHSKSTLKMFAQYKIGEVHPDERGKAPVKESSGSSKSCVSIISCGLCG